jgi:hypothetical protein
MTVMHIYTVQYICIIQLEGTTNGNSCSCEQQELCYVNCVPETQLKCYHDSSSITK